MKHETTSLKLYVAKPLQLQWRHNEHDGAPNNRRPDCLLNRLFRRRSKKTSKLRVTGLCEGNSPVTGEFPTQRASDVENVSIWLRYHNVNQYTDMLSTKLRNVPQWHLRHNTKIIIQEVAFENILCKT